MIYSLNQAQIIENTDPIFKSPHRGDLGGLHNLMKKLFILTVLLSTISLCKAEDINKFNYIIGTQTIGPKYQFTNESMLIETARQIRAMGSNILKITLDSKQQNLSGELKTLKDVVQKDTSMQKVLSMDFSYYFFWAYELSSKTGKPVNSFIDGLTDAEADDAYKQMYDLSCYLLTKFSGTGKAFYLGNWEGDWHLFRNYNIKQEPDPAAITGMTRWLQVRQKAVDDAKRDTNHKNVQLYFYVELNQSAIAMEGKTCVANSILPTVNPDFVSFSSYDATNPPKSYEEMQSTLTKALNHIESKLQKKAGLPDGKRVFIGEFGWPEIKTTQTLQVTKTKWVARTAMVYGCPFVLWWEMYNNEIDAKTNQQIGYWLITDKNEKTQLYFVLQAFYKESREYLKQFKNKNKKLPSQQQYHKDALEFESLKL